MQEPKLNRTYKDRLFRMVFKEKKDLLALYNALNHTEYTDEEDVTVTTLDDVIYMTVKNDISFIIGDVLTLWEQQSTFNPNMPVRGLMYFASIYREYMEDNDMSLFSSRLHKLPFPRYTVFYNGLKEEPDRMILRLTDAFADENGNVPADEPSLEVKAEMININPGKNSSLMEECESLKGYAVFVSKVRENKKNGQEDEPAVDNAINYCIANNYLKDVLSKNRKEVVQMFLTEFDEEKYIAMVRQEGREEEKVHSLKILVQILKLPIEQALALLEIPEAEQEKYLKTLL